MPAPNSIRGFRPHTVRDQLRYLLNPARVRVPAFRVIDRLNDFTPGEQILGTAVALRAMCESAGINLSDVMQHSSNIMAHADGPFSAHIAAIRDYAANELARVDTQRPR